MTEISSIRDEAEQFINNQRGYDALPIGQKYFYRQYVMDQFFLGKDPMTLHQWLAERILR